MEGIYDSWDSVPQDIKNIIENEYKKYGGECEPEGYKDWAYWTAYDTKYEIIWYCREAYEGGKSYNCDYIFDYEEDITPELPLHVKEHIV
jgi:hypothetical protein